jgi:hypothetical protein
MFALVGCVDGRIATGPELTPPAAPAAYSAPMTTLRATVDLEAGTLTFTPLVATNAGYSLPAGFSASIYGNQGVTVRIYNSAVTVTNPSSPGKKTFSAPVGIRNLLPHPIGDEQATGTPTDTMGIDIFINSGPTVTATSSVCAPACTVTAKNPDGKRAFSAPNQAYWHWQEIVGSAGSARDTTLTRKLWVFEADTQVTNFSFDVSVNAAWPAPFETRWKVEFSADSAPTAGTSARWHQMAGSNGAATMNSPGAGLMTLVVPNKGVQLFTRDDGIVPSSDAYVEARVRRNTGGTGEQVAFGIDDGVTLIAVGLSVDGQIGFLDDAFDFFATTSTTTTTLQTYQLRKVGNTTVELWLVETGTLLLSRPYASFPASPTGFADGVFFGDPDGDKSKGPISSTWDYVTYEIGVSRP